MSNPLPLKIPLIFDNYLLKCIDEGEFETEYRVTNINK